MKTQSDIKAIPYPSLIELVFSSKNKAYGAYVIRKSYEKNLITALIITVVISVILLAGPVLLRKETSVQINNVGKKPGETTVDLIDATTPQDEKPIDIPVEPVRPLKETIRFVEPRIEEDILVQNEYLPPEQIEMQDKNIGTKNIEGVKDGFYYIPEEIPAEDIAGIVEPVKNEAFSWVEEMPSFQGGVDAFMNFIQDNIRYPEIAKKAGIEGRVIIQFVVERDGSLSEMLVMKSVGGGCDEEAIRVLKMSGKWNPGKQNGKAVRVKMVVPFLFRLT